METIPMKIIPAIDIIGGRCVRLEQGRYASQKTYSADPAAMAKKFEDAGAELIHVVDLDGAKAASVKNFGIVESIRRKSDAAIEFGGGISSVEIARQLIDIGANKLIIGSKAVTDPDFVIELADRIGIDRIIIAADVNDNRIAINAWQDGTEMRIEDFLLKFTEIGFRRFICTDISKDGMLSGPAVGLYKQIKAAFPMIKLTASGGVGRIEDIAMLNTISVDGVIVGKAFYENKIPLSILKNGGRYAG